MAREIDEAFIEQAIERYQRLETRFAEFDRALRRVEVTVSSPDGLVDVVVGGDGTIRDVTINGVGGGPAQLSRAVREAVAAATDAAAWARAKLHGETFGDYRPLGEV